MDKSVKKRPLRVCILTNIPAPYRLPVFESLGQYVNLTVFYCKDSSSERQWTIDIGSENVQNDILTSLKLPFVSKYFTYNPTLRSILLNELFDVYIAGENFDTASSVITLQKAAQRQKKPFIIWSEAIDTQYASGNIVSNQYRKCLYRKADYFLAYSEMASTFLKHRKVPMHKIKRGYQIVPDEQLRPPTKNKKQLGFADKIVLLYLGYFEPRKGLDLLITTFKGIPCENCCLVLVGDGPQKQDLQSLASEDSRIHFMPYSEGVEKSNWLHAADLFVLPTQHDPWGLVVNEAMMAGLPIITTQAAAVSEIIDENGFIIPPNDPSALRQALETLIHQSDLRLKFGERSQKIIKKYDVALATSAFLDVINHTQQMDITTV